MKTLSSLFRFFSLLPLFVFSILLTSPLRSVGAQEPAAGDGQTVVVPALRGLILVSDVAQAAAPVPADFRGIDVSRVPLLQAVRADVQLAGFIGQPATLASLQTTCELLRGWLQRSGQSFVVAYVPPQDVTEGVVRVVVANARLDGPMTIEGAKWFSEKSYRAALPLAAGEALDAEDIRSGIEQLNRSAYRRVDLAASPGATPGTTHLELRVQERQPWGLNAAYSNTGSPTTGEDRVSADVTWGNAFGRGDVLGYTFSADPGLQHLRSHSANYATTFASGRTLTGFGSWSSVTSAMPAPLTQNGTSWQAGLRFNQPLRAPREGWTQNLSVSADFKYSDNTLEFATLPITDNETHVAQLGATYGVSFRALGGQNALSVSGFASPGGLTSHNDTAAFAGSRPGAKASYVYGKLIASHRRGLPRGFSWVSSAEAQAASGALLGSEQLNGGGSSAVRGYGESTAFGDWGVVTNHELHAPGLNLTKDRDHLDLFAFVDLASLNLNVDRESTDLRSAGVGLNYQWSRHVNVRASYGWQLKRLDNSTDKARGHISANVSF